MARTLDGDLDAYAGLVARYTAVAHRAAVLAGAGDDAEDVVQEAFVKAFRKLQTFRLGQPFRPWLLRIVLNEASNARRSLRRREALALRANHRGHIEGPEAGVLGEERRHALLAAVRALPDRDRLVLSCRFFLELTEAETAHVLGWPIGSVKSRTARALAKLRSTVPREEVSGA
ncbi:MAG TPA: sigma-70 family RNA polymerase sigma factor [Pseudonocardiaceae bacterium]